MEYVTLIISVASIIGVGVLIVMIQNQLKKIKQLESDILNNQDAFEYEMRYIEDRCKDNTKWNVELIKKKYDDLCNSHSKLDNRVCDLTSTMWNIDGKMQTLDPYIKRIHLKHLIKTSGSINKSAIKELKAVENELK
jgi:hypothetical protein